MKAKPNKLDRAAAAWHRWLKAMSSINRAAYRGEPYAPAFRAHAAGWLAGYAAAKRDARTKKARTP